VRWTLLRDGQSLEVHEPDARVLRDLLLPDEVESIRGGALVAEIADVVQELDSPLPPGGTVTLRPPNPFADNAPFLYPVNAHGEAVRIDELIAIRRFEEAHGERLWGLPLATIRQRVSPTSASPEFFENLGARERARERFGTRTRHGRLGWGRRSAA